jgi:hypothetical protein
VGSRSLVLLCDAYELDEIHPKSLSEIAQLSVYMHCENIATFMSETKTLSSSH